jgi:hypothetical protein
MGSFTQRLAFNGVQSELNRQIKGPTFDAAPRGGLQGMKALLPQSFTRKHDPIVIPSGQNVLHEWGELSFLGTIATATQRSQQRLSHGKVDRDVAVKSKMIAVTADEPVTSLVGQPPKS